MAKIRAFEIYLNDKRLCVAGLEQGDLLFSISDGQNKQGRGEVGLGMTGLLPTMATVRWQQRSLRMNDQGSNQHSGGQNGRQVRGVAEGPTGFQEIREGVCPYDGEGVRLDDPSEATRYAEATN